MTKNRDLKDLIRARMQKTGESYTAARASFLGPDPKHIAPRSQWAALAGIKDPTVKDRTSKTWAQWVDVLDQARAFEWEHPKIAKYLSGRFPISGWWAQSITVGYERIHGIREVGQSGEGTFDANKSKTFDVPVAKLYAMWADGRRRKRWLAEKAIHLRNQRENKSLIIDWSDGTQVNVSFIDKGAKSAVQLQHKRLASKDDIQSRKTFWDGRLLELESALD